MHPIKIIGTQGGGSEVWCCFPVPTVSANCRKKNDSLESVSIISNFCCIVFIAATPLALVSSSGGVRVCVITVTGKSGTLLSVLKGEGKVMKMKVLEMFDSY